VTLALDRVIMSLPWTATSNTGAAYGPGNWRRISSKARRHPVFGGVLMKQCSECGEVKAIIDFRIKNDRRIPRHSSKCKSCESRKHWLRIKWNPEKMFKQRARNAVWRAVKRGEINRPTRCSSCWNNVRVIHAHHDNYKNKLDVKWLCVQCHVSSHGVSL